MDSGSYVMTLYVPHARTDVELQDFMSSLWGREPLREMNGVTPVFIPFEESDVSNGVNGKGGSANGPRLGEKIVRAFATPIEARKHHWG